MPDLLAGGSLLDDLGINLRVVVFQASVFILLFLFLSRFVFGRVHSFMTSREEETKAALDRIERGRAELERLTKDYEARMAQVEKEAYARLQEILKQGIETRTRLLAESQAKARSEVESARRDIAGEKERAMAQLRSDVVGLTLQAVEKVIERPLDPGAGEAVRRMLAEQRP